MILLFFFKIIVVIIINIILIILVIYFFGTIVFKVTLMDTFILHGGDVLIAEVDPWTFWFYCYTLVHLWRDVGWTAGRVTVVLDDWCIGLVDVIMLEKHAFWFDVYLWVLVFGDVECFELVVIFSFTLIWHFSEIFLCINFGGSSWLIFGDGLWGGCWHLIGDGL